MCVCVWKVVRGVCVCVCGKLLGVCVCVWKVVRGVCVSVCV